MRSASPRWLRSPRRTFLDLRRDQPGRAFDDLSHGPKASTTRRPSRRPGHVKDSFPPSCLLPEAPDHQDVADSKGSGQLPFGLSASIELGLQLVTLEPGGFGAELRETEPPPFVHLWPRRNGEPDLIADQLVEDDIDVPGLRSELDHLLIDPQDLRVPQTDEFRGLRFLTLLVHALPPQMEDA
jgi:hypothetical protein